METTCTKIVNVNAASRLPISFRCQIETKLHVGRSAHATPSHGIAWDWVVGTRDPSLAIADPAYVLPAPVTQPISFIPVAAKFKGMPNPRFWEMEERHVNFGALEAQTTDQLLLVFAELVAFTATTGTSCRSAVLSIHCAK